MKTSIRKTALFTLLIVTGAICAFSPRDNDHARGSFDLESLSGSTMQQIQTPDLKFEDENGKTISLHSLQGKVVFINLWATWCPPCVREMPSIHALRNTFKDNNDLVFLMVDVDGNLEKSKKWMQRKKFDLPVHIPASEIPRDLFRGSIPTTFIVDKNNTIVGRHVGGANYASKEIIDLMTELLKEK